MFVRLQSAVFDPGAETNAFMKGREETGALASFAGTVRSSADAPVESLTLEYYPELADVQIGKIAAEAIQRFGLADLGIIHRHGTLKRGEPIVLVMALAAHRQEALDAVSFVMDYLKTDAPFWKKERGPKGDTWVAARQADIEARRHWEKKK